MPATKDLVLVGGGHAHAGVVRAWGMHPEPGVRVRCVSPSEWTAYSGMLPGHVAGHYSAPEMHLDLRRLCRWAGVEFIRARLVGLDPARRQVLLEGRPPLGFDVVSLNTGSTPSMSGIPGAAEHAVPVKPVDPFLRRWAGIRARARESRQQPFRVVTVGGGTGGVELLLAIRHRLLEDAREAGQSTTSRFEFHLVTAGGSVPGGHPPRVRRRIASELERRAVRVHFGSRVVAVEPGTIRCDDGRRIGFDVLFWTTQASPPDWLADTGLARSDDGFLSVNESLQSVSHPFVFGAGDLATMTPHRRPKSGVFAVRQGGPLGGNLRRYLRGEPLRPFRPQRQFLSLISLGDRSAVASRGWLTCAGHWVWRWKDGIDRRWMRAYRDLPETSGAASGSDPGAMRCGGCGAKVGPDILGRVLRRLELPAPRDEVLVGCTEPDDASVVRVPEGQVLVESVDFLRDFVGDPYLLGRMAANHALGDLHAMGVAPRTAHALATIPWGGAAQMEETLFQLLSGAAETLRAEGVALVGGHSSEGAELGVGFAVQGWAWPGEVWRKGGLADGQALVLTRALGTGVVLAAERSGLRLGRGYDEALDGLLVSQAAAVGCLRRHGATACTDVTGFGLIGHLLEMLDASRVSAGLDTAAVPVLEGAVLAAAAGVRSSLFPENHRRAARVDDPVPAGREREIELLYDPQTAGGLLAGVPADRAEACVDALHALGYGVAAIIGRVEPARTDGRAVRWIDLAPARPAAPAAGSGGP